MTEPSTQPDSRCGKGVEDELQSLVKLANDKDSPIVGRYDGVAFMIMPGDTIADARKKFASASSSSK